MAYSKSYVGDTKALAVITQTINKKNALIPGVTVKAELAGLVQANVAEYYYNLAPNVAEKTAGEDFDTTNRGNKKAILTLENALQLDEKIPYAALDSIAAPQMYDTIQKAALTLSNKLGAKFMTSLKGLAQAKTYTKGATMFDAIADGIGTFAQASSVKVGGVADTSFSNTENGVQPTTIIVGDTGRAKLFKTDAFQRTINATGKIDRLIGTMLGMDVVYAQDLTDVDFMLINAEGVAFPYSINTLRAVESENFNGVRIQGEVGYPTAGYGILPIDSFALKFTEAKA